MYYSILNGHAQIAGGGIDNLIGDGGVDGGKCASLLGTYTNIDIFRVMGPS